MWPRRVQLLSATGLEPTDAEVAQVADHTEGWSAGVYLAALSAKVSRTGMNGVTEFRGDDRFVAEYLVSELLSRLTRDELLFLTPERRPRAHVGRALRRGPRAERLRDAPGIAGGFQPVRGTARPDRPVVSLPPPVPGAAALRARARRARSRAAPARTRRPMVRGERAAGGRDRVRAGRRGRRPSGAAGRLLRSARLPERSGRHGRTLARVAGVPPECSSRTRRSRCSAHCSPPCGGALRRPTGGRTLRRAAATRAPCPMAATSIDSWLRPPPRAALS